ncbi:MAG: thiamine biosynthesis protein ThiS [Flavobacteriaceae bacterium]|nr:MAG: thiamine biosynthesis protein ThiS [Flavobacteriaceae bacterium]
MITIFHNELPLEIGDNLNVLQLLHKIQSPTSGVAIAINQAIISQTHWESTILKQNDTLLIIQATQGG